MKYAILLSFGVLFSLVGSAQDQTSSTCRKAASPATRATYGTKTSDISSYFKREFSDTQLPERFSRAIFKVLIDCNGDVQRVAPVSSKLDEVLQQKIENTLLEMPQWSAAQDVNGNVQSTIYLVVVFNNQSINIEQY